MASRPNILVITDDDLGATTAGCFGGRPDTTPALDRLAGEGMSFHRAHVPIAVCQPSRSAMMTGLLPHHNGAEGFEPIDDGVPLLTNLLHDVGYRCGILGKVNHLEPVERFDWDFVRQRDDLGVGRDPRRYAAHAAHFIAESADRPWFLLANAHDPHRPFAGSAEERRRFDAGLRAQIPLPSRTFRPDEIDVPGFLPDLAGVRQETAEYLNSARRLDDVVGELLRTLDDSGQREHTMVVFFSDHGMPFPFAKANCYVASTQTPLLIRWPGRTQAGRRDEEHFVSTMDLLPTLCAAAGIDPPAVQDGRSLLPLIRGEDEPDRDAAVTAFHETSAKRRYEMRAVHTATHSYVWNAWSDGEREYRAENMEGLTWPAMLGAADTDPVVHARVRFYRHRQPEEFYDLRDDPHQLRNRAADAAVRSECSALRERLLRELIRSGDPLRDRFAAHVRAVATR